MMRQIIDTIRQAFEPTDERAGGRRPLDESTTVRH
jgi:hypothetical protein